MARNHMLLILLAGALALPTAQAEMSADVAATEVHPASDPSATDAHPASDPSAAASNGALVPAPLKVDLHFGLADDPARMSGESFQGIEEDRASLPAPVFTWLLNNMGDLKECPRWVRTACTEDYNIVSYLPLRKEEEIIGYAILQKRAIHREERKLLYILDPEGEILTMHLSTEQGRVLVLNEIFQL